MTAAHALATGATTAARGIASGAGAALRAVAESAPLGDLGRALVHSVWQLAAVALALAAALALLREASAHARYCVACLALLAMLVLPVATFFTLESRGGSQTAERRTELSTTEMSDPAARAGVGAGAHAASRAGAADSSDADGDAGAARAWISERAEALLPWVALAWGACAAVLLLRLAGGWAWARRLRRGAASAQALVGCQVMLARLRGRLRVSRAVRVCRSALVEVPTVAGWLRPVILVPACALAGLSPAQLEAVIAHELAHVRRQDYLFNLLQAVVEALLFYHPAVWWVSRRIRAEREHACDDLAVEATGDALSYARTLAALEQLRGDQACAPRLALAADGGSLVARIRRLIDAQPSHPSRSRRAPAASAVAASLALACALALAHAATRVSTGERGGASRAGAQGGATRRRVAVTFVSLPMVHTPQRERAERDTQRLLASLRANDVRAVGFVSSSQLYDREGAVRQWRVQLLRSWLDAGMELGSQGFSHPDLYNTPLEEYERDIVRGEELTGQLARERGARLRYFSYPFLNVGPSPETKEAFETFLAARDMKVHKITIDNLDWLFGKAYADALAANDEETARRVAEEYVPYMERVFDFYERLSRDTLGREPPQVLMLTADALNCEKFDELAAMLRRRGYRFVTLEEAQGDPAYQQPDTYTGAWGISWLQRWAMARGARFREEPYLSPYMEQFDTYTKKWQRIDVEQR